MARELADERCVACRRGSPRATAEEMAEFLPAMPAWRLVEVDGVPRLVRVFQAPDYAAGLALTVRLAGLAEAEGHHPAILLEWDRVTVSWWTHAIGGLRRNDLILAARTDRLAADLGFSPVGADPGSPATGA